MSILNNELRLSGIGGRVRPAAVAGTFYPADPVRLQQMLDDMLGAAAPAGARAHPAGTPPKALIVPHAGYVYSGPIAASGYRLLASGERQVRRVVLLGPAHRVAFRGIALPTVDRFRTPLGDVPVDRELAARLADLEYVGSSDQPHALEHCLEVHLPFLQTMLPEFSVLPIVVGQASAAEVATVIRRLWGGPETLIVVSSDLSHYLEYASARERDARTCTAITALNPDAFGPDDACGCLPISGLLLEARRRGMSIETLDVRNSGDTAGTRDRVVGYAAFALRETRGAAEDGAGPDEDKQLLDIVRRSIQSGFSSGAPLLPDPASLAGGLGTPAAVFVTLLKDGNLRGCIGGLEPAMPLARAVAEAAFKSAFRDPRFPPLDRHEWPGISIGISILGPREPVRFSSDADLVRQLRPGKDGLVIANGTRSATFLPSVWETLRDPGEFLAHLKQKAGIPPSEAVMQAWCYEARYVNGKVAD